MSELRAQAADLIEVLDDDQLRRLLAYAYRLMHEGRDLAPASGLESLLEESA
ncbi:MAG TPA: hypothetical protein VFM29_04410 [Vicinamibacteria bacterium]|nr:hypothetical protein [Vicinamibacteria bacterium]